MLFLLYCWSGNSKNKEENKFDWKSCLIQWKCFSMLKNKLIAYLIADINIFLFESYEFYHSQISIDIQNSYFE